MCCCMLIINFSKVIFYQVLIFPADSPRLLYAYHKLKQGNLLSLLIFPADSNTLIYVYHKIQQDNLLSCANIALLQAVLLIHCSKVTFYHVSPC